MKIIEYIRKKRKRCIECGARLPEQGRGPPRKFCCDKCNIKWWDKILNKKYTYKNCKRKREHSKKYQRENMITKTETVKRDICPKCNERGRFRIHSRINKKTGNVCKFLQVDHWKQEDGKKKYSHCCYLGVYHD